RNVLSRAKGSAHGYVFDHEMSYTVWPDLPFCALPNGHFAPCHTAELPMVFGNPYSLSGAENPQRHSFNPEERALSNQIIDYWTQFATHHDLTGTKPEWPKHPATQVLATPIRTDPSGAADSCPFWDRIGYVQSGLFRHF